MSDENESKPAADLSANQMADVPANVTSNATASPTASMTRRDTLRLATAVGALGAGLGATFAEGNAFAEAEWIKSASFQKLKVASKDLGTVALKISYIKSDGSTQLLHALDLTPHFLKLDASKGEAINFTVTGMKERAVPLLNHSIFVVKE